MDDVAFRKEELELTKPTGYEFTTTLEKLEEFFDGVIWKDLLGYLEEVTDEFRERLEDPMLTGDALQLLRGAITNQRSLLDFKAIVLDAKRCQMEEDDQVDESFDSQEEEELYV